MKNNLTYSALDIIRNAIVNGEFGLGESLSEIKICEKYNLSKTPVREAFSVLKNEGLLNRISRKGTFVFDITVNEIQHIAESRFLLEDYVIKNSMLETPKILVNSLSRVYEKMETAADKNDYQKFLELDTEFHKTFFISCKNKYLINFYNILSNKSQALKYYVVKTAVEGGEGLGSHKSILDDVINNDLTSLSNNLSQHLTIWINKYVSTYKINPRF